MLRIVLVGVLMLVTLAGGWALVGRPAQAQPAFKMRWDQKYFTEESAMKKTYGTSSCNFCHIGGADDRKHRNDYGQALSKLLKKEVAADLTTKKRNEEPDVYKKAEEKVFKALEAVEKQHSNPKDKTSPTFGDLIKEGKLPKSPAVLPEK